MSEENVERQNASGRDLEEFAVQLNTLSGLNIEQNQNSLKNWSELQKGLSILSRYEVGNMLIDSELPFTLTVISLCHQLLTFHSFHVKNYFET